ncbi:MAG: helix-turn-helix transcriptional regulator [Flavobacteriales bacterium]
MATNKNAQVRYNALDRCFAHKGKRYFWEDLLVACNAALDEISGGGKGIAKRQLMDDIKFMESDQGWSIPLDRNKEDKRVWYRYSSPDFSISKRPLNEEEAEQLNAALMTLSRFKGMPQFQWVDELSARLESGFGLRQGAERIIEFEENPYLKGSEHITKLFQAILGGQVLQVTYQGFRQPEPVQRRIHPYYLKQYNNRWFLFGWEEERAQETTLALDRIHAIEQISGEYRQNTEDYSEYFADIVGVSIPEGEVETIELAIAAERWPYIKTKPLHETQSPGTPKDGNVHVRLKVKPNYELETLLLSYGEDVWVVKPDTLRKTLQARAKAMAANYEK